MMRPSVTEALARLQAAREDRGALSQTVRRLAAADERAARRMLTDALLSRSLHNHKGDHHVAHS